MSIRPKPLSGAEALITFINDEMLERRVAFPAEIVAVNCDPPKVELLSVDVLPLVRQTVSKANTDELIYRDLPVLTNVPVVFPQSTVSGFALTLPIQIGDQVLIVIADRSIDEWQVSGKIGNPVESATPRAHDLTDAIAIIGISCDANNVSQYDFDRISMRNKTRTKYVSVSNNSVEVVAGASTVIADDNGITLSFGGSSITINGSGVSINGASVTINGSNYNTHFHMIGGSPTSPPQN